MAALVEATVWRIRRLKQQEARRRDKEQIASLTQQISNLRWTLWSWEAWSCREWKQHNEGDHDEVEAALRALDSPQVMTGSAPRECTSVIDYSKWDRLECSSDEDVSSEEDGVGSEKGATYTDDCYWCEEALGETGEVDDWDGEEEGEADLAKEEKEAEEDTFRFDEALGIEEEEDEEAEGQTVEEKAAEDVATAPLVADWSSSVEASVIGAGQHVHSIEATGYQHRPSPGASHSERKAVCLDCLACADADIKQAWKSAVAASAWMPSIAKELARQEEQTCRQLSAYSMAIEGMNTAEFEETKTKQLLDLLASWRAELLGNIRSIANESRDAK